MQRAARNYDMGSLVNFLLRLCWCRALSSFSDLLPADYRLLLDILTLSKEREYVTPAEC